MKVIAILPQGLETEGAKELIELGATSIKVLNRSISFEVDLGTFYRIHLYARLPFRFLREIAQFRCNGPDSLYEGVQKAFNWKSWLKPSQSFYVDVSGKNIGLSHSHFTALQVKNALIDLQRITFGNRSSINLEDPDYCIHLHLSNDMASLSLATTRYSLHRRGYRPVMGLAPVKENIVSGLIRLTNWDSSVPLIDPLCGSGTFLIEAASIALGILPNLNRHFLFELWPDFNSVLWRSERDKASRLSDKSKKTPKIVGCEANKEIASQAKKNISFSGLEHTIEINNIPFQDLVLPPEKGLIICNPPYGKRIGNEQDLFLIYQELGNFLKENASGWHFWLLNGNPNLSRALRMKSVRRYPINNGGIDCRWMHYPIN